MKIIVNSENEKKLLERFFEAMHDLDMVEELNEIDQKTCGDDTYLDSYDEIFLRQAICDVSVMVDSSVQEIYVEHYNLQGKCVDCGIITEGTIDGEDISYDEWMDKTSDESVKSWKCESCFNKGEE
ncbi:MULTISPECIES: hypothetical protein [Pelosinus]|uniref:Uncharacterized protein n=1 Tax=Pelosinus fermentans B4 TaxID=1149862 RepID=I9LJX5_9FIRM|nr:MULTISPECIES: hypothetical protein [Pelosinus]EIW20731.1 hypothetical protein FB4_1943 [Pelosinus fermentans B4]EIW25424.1 hypothetical protein FA11_2583 [Pelosinus fermentans A11]OAM93682.1 hypothetical protein FR7_01699 [Pelosinus fermentans DSM 17108]SDQ86431.1 hypothetical protein SAMN04515679_1785 [Pelosinus fermentans]